MGGDRQQPGIYFRGGERPKPSYRSLLLCVPSGVRPGELSAALERIWRMLGELQRGDVRDLDGQDAFERSKARAELGSVDVMLGLGPRLFEGLRHDPLLVSAAAPEMLVALENDREPLPGVPWAERRDQSAHADLVLQLTGPTEAAVARTAVEIWKLIVDERLPFEVSATFSGFARGDGRGWLDFHDGVSNLPSEERLTAITAGREVSWMAGGTYMAFLRFAVDLRVWRALRREQQELIVGRDKLTGRPVIAVSQDPGGVLRPVVESGDAAADRVRVPGRDFREPPDVVDPLVKASHLQRANRNRASPAAPAGQRIFRQGYEFLAEMGPSGPRLGLNFVSFQGDLGGLRRVLHLPGWLGDVNFGGSTDAADGMPQVSLISLLCGGFFCVPPRAEPFPGASLFGS
jgi:deferrochelatase/peroxidase EfeB